MDKNIAHYRMYLRIYGLLLISAADDDELVGQLVRGEAEGVLMQAVRDRIENSP
jgi:hypothetical protein